MATWANWSPAQESTCALQIARNSPMAKTCGTTTAPQGPCGDGPTEQPGAPNLLDFPAPGPPDLPPPGALDLPLRGPLDLRPPGALVSPRPGARPGRAQIDARSAIQSAAQLSQRRSPSGHGQGLAWYLTVFAARHGVLPQSGSAAAEIVTGYRHCVMFSIAYRGRCRRASQQDRAESPST
jgi:hypothetical protein